MKGPVLDPLWITKGISEFDSEYYKYIILSANKQWRDNLNEGDYSDFYEIMFHSLNLNNLAIEGSMFDFKMNPIWDDPKFKEIRRHLRNLYKLPDEVITIFKNTNFTLTRLIIDYLTQMLDSVGLIKIYFTNPMIHNEKDIYMILNDLNNPGQYNIWKLKFDRRLKFGYSIDHIETLEIDDLDSDNAIELSLDQAQSPEVDKMDPDHNVMVISYDQDQLQSDMVHTISYAILFSKGIVRSENFQPAVLEELLDLLSTENVMPFTIKSWQ